jgi:predicted metal-binding protein
MVNPGCSQPGFNLMKYKKYLDLAKKSGAAWDKIINPEDVVTAEWVRLKCQYGCNRYGTCLTCPPYSPTPEQTKRMLKDYSKALIMVYDIPPERNERDLRKKLRKDVAKFEREMFLDGYYKAFGMACGPCNLCKICNLSYPCKFEEIARPSMEACGIDVYQTLANVDYRLRVVKSLKEGCKFCSLILIE